LEFAANWSGVPADQCRLEADAVVCGEARTLLSDLYLAAEERGRLLHASRKAYGSPRSLAFNCQAFRVGVHRVTGEVMILQSVQAADAGTVINPMQCRGQVEGAVTQGLGWALYEKM